MNLEEKRKLIDEYMSACPFIEKYDILFLEIDDEWARVEIDMAFDGEERK